MHRILDPATLAAWSRRVVRNYGWKRCRVGRAKLKRLLSAFMPPEAEIVIRSGLRMHLDLNRSMQFLIFWFSEEVEPALQWTIRSLLPVGGTFVDCGANVGLMGLLAIHERQAFSCFVEPHPRLAAAIRRNLALSGYEAYASVHECAASDREGETDFYVHSRDDGRHSLERLPEGETIRVRVSTLPRILEACGLGRVDLLKVDTEGHDYPVLTGLGDCLVPSSIRMLYVEMGAEQEAIATLLQGRGYRGFPSVPMYIDTLRRLRRREDDCLVAYFRELREGERPLNTLWVGAGTAEEALLRRVATLGVAP